MRRGVSFALLALLWLVVPLVHGATFGLSPMRVELSPAAPTAAVTVTNNGDAPLTVQIQPHTWSQREGQDVYGETRDFIVSPPIFTVPAGGRQIVRIASRGAAPATTEQAYRLIFREVPPTQEGAAASSDGGAVFRIVLAMNIPMYLAPAAGAPAPKPRFTLETGPDGAARVRIANDGTGHLRLADLSVAQGNDNLATQDVMVVLPGAAMYLNLAKGKLVSGGPVDFRAKSNGGAVALSLDVAKP